MEKVSDPKVHRTSGEEIGSLPLELMVYSELYTLY